jgi:hypothetical protein
MAHDRDCHPAGLKSVRPPADVASLRGHVAIVRTLLDEFERAMVRRDSDEDDGPVSAAQQLSGELMRLSHEIRDVTDGEPRSLRAVVVPVAEASGPRCIDAGRPQRV